MPNSLKCKIKRLCHNGTITERERDRILKALEQEPCEDAVSREAVLDAVKNNYRMAAIDVIEKLPSVQPERPKGEWEIAGMFDDFYKCSCGFKYSQLFNRYNFCPNCGKDMRKEDKNEIQACFI